MQYEASLTVRALLLSVGSALTCLPNAQTLIDLVKRSLPNPQGLCRPTPQTLLHGAHQSAKEAQQA
eukprot:6207478-Pleurochrysis_carterae.AAC.3